MTPPTNTPPTNTPPTNTPPTTARPAKPHLFSPTGALSPRRLLTVVVLTGAWCALWGSISAANVLSGLLLSAVVVRPSIGPAGVGTVRPIALLRLIAVVFTDLVVSTFTVAWEVLTPTDRTEESIVEVHLPAEARSHLLLLVIAITLTPGTAVVDADPDTGTLYLHLLHDERRAETVAHVARLAQLVEAALPLSSAPTLTTPEVAS